MKTKFKMNLQLFAEGDAPTGAESGAADPAVTGAGTEGTPGEDPKVEKAFSARLAQEKGKIEAQYSPYKAVIESQAKAQGMSADEYIAFLETQRIEKEAEAAGKTPEYYKLEQEKLATDAKLKAYERNDNLSKEEKALTSDPVLGKFVTDNLARIREIAESADVSLDVSLALVAREQLPELMKLTNPDLHIQNYLKGLKEGKKPVEFGGPTVTPSGEKPKTFDAASASAKEKLKSMK